MEMAFNETAWSVEGVGQREEDITEAGGGRDSSSERAQTQ